MKKIIWITVILVAFLAVFSLGVSADEKIPNEMYYGREILASMENSTALLYAYDSLVSGIEEASELITVYDGKNPITQEEIDTVIDLYTRDHTEQFWLGLQYGISYNSETVVEFAPTYIFSGEALAAAKNTFNSEVNKILSGIDENMSDFEKELYLHDALISRIVYIDGTNAHNAYGALIDGRAVCEGYSELFQYLLQRSGIRSFIAKGNSKGVPHAWNYVLIDGKYYHTDVTWDDQGESIFHTYFNQPDRVMKEEHTVSATKYPLPKCDSDEAQYFNVMGGSLKTYSADIVAVMLKNGNYKTHIYIPGDMNAFMAWLSSNFEKIVTKLGLEGEISAGVTSVGREIVLVLTGELEDSTYDPIKLKYASVTLGSDLSVNFYVSKEDGCEIDMTDVSIRVIFNGKITVIDTFRNSDGYYVFSFEGIEPQQMADPMTVELLCSGVKTDEKKDYSIKKNAEDLLREYSDNAEVVRLVSDMLHYGAAAQKYKNYNIGNLATDEVDGLLAAQETLPERSDKKLETAGEPKNVYFVAAGVHFDRANKLYVKLSTAENAKLTVKIGESVVGIFTGMTGTVVYTEDIKPTDFDTVYIFELYDGDTLVQKFTYSVDSYCHSMQSSENEKMKALATALYNFGSSAKAYKNTEKEN